MASATADAQAFIDALVPEQRPLFDRVQRLITELAPHVEVVLAYKMPTFEVGGHRLHVGVWKHGVSFYGWDEERDDGFATRHPELSSGRGTLRLPTKVAATIDDAELQGFLRATLLD